MNSRIAGLHALGAILAASASMHKGADAIEEYHIKRRKEDEKMLRPVKFSVLPAQKPYGKKYRRHNK